MLKDLENISAPLQDPTVQTSIQSKTQPSLVLCIASVATW